MPVYTRCCVLECSFHCLKKHLAQHRSSWLVTKFFCTLCHRDACYGDWHSYHWKDLHVQAEGFVRRPQVLRHILQHALKVTHPAPQSALVSGRGAGAGA